MELIGITGTLFIIIAFTLSGELKIRIFDLVGATLFIIYGVMIHSFSTILLNGVLVLIQIYKIRTILKNERLWWKF